MSTFLFVRAQQDLVPAIAAVNNFLVHRRQNEEPRDVKRVLGIWLRRELNANLPQAKISESAVGVQESHSYSGLWTLCLMDGDSLCEAQNASERRYAIVDALRINLSQPQPHSSTTRPFFPVFAETDDATFINEAMSELSNRYPGMVADTWFIDDWAQGIVAQRTWNLN